ncbi:MAG: acetyl-CoA carboxylase biotin carboxyl carrier protein [Planctomycetota bacterium]
MIDIRKLKELVKLMVENELSELDLRDTEETVTIKRGAGGAIVPMVGAAPVPAAAVAAPAQADGGQSAETPAVPAGDAGLVAIKSPMPGTFYSASSPDSESFVAVGGTVSEGSIVCIIEAMKVFNEIKSDVSGTIERICVKNQDAVEFGQPLFMVRPA